MNRQRVLIFISSLLVVLFIHPHGSSRGQTLPQKPARGFVQGPIAKNLDEYLTRITPFGFSGALLAAKDGEIILNRGYGLAVRSTDTPNTSETVFSTGSITKQFTAAGIMKLEMLGKLSADDPITKYFGDVPEDKKGITLHHLLTHTAGVVNFTGPDYIQAEREETVRKVLEAPLSFKPGERFMYSNAGFSLLAAVIEKVSGQSYEELLRENLFKPAGMEFTGYRLPEWEKKAVAHWYVGEKDNGTPLEKPYPYWNLLGNGGILSTTTDMYRWHLALLGDRILSVEAKKKMFTPFLNDYGYGWDVLQTPRGILIQHDGGSMLGNSAEMRRYIDAGAVSILFCNQSFGQRPLMEAVRDEIEQLLFGGKVEVPPPVQSLDSEALRKYEGAYVLPKEGSFRVKAAGEGLIISADGQDAINALFGTEKADVEQFKELNKLSVAIFEAAVRGDYEPFSRVLFHREMRLDPLREMIEMRLRQHEKRTGKIREVLAGLTLPAEFDGQKAAQTFVELKGERGSLFFILYWRGETNFGVAPAMSLPDISIPFLPLSGHEFAGYELEMARNFRITFKVDKKKSATRLIFRTKKRQTSALRERE